MTAVVEGALDRWGWTGATATLAAVRENQVYRVESPQGTVALRLHRKGYRTEAELTSELAWMAALGDGGLSVPSPIADRTGAVLVVVDDVQVDALTWLPGRMLDDALPPAPGPQRTALFRELGAGLARLHALSDAWEPPAGFTRVQWDSPGLLGEAPVWDRFWDNPGLCADDLALFLRFRDHARGILARTPLDIGLIHADLVPANVLVDGGTLRFIDFDDGGFGYRLFDVATALFKHQDAPDYPALKHALIEGYKEHRPLDVALLDLFFALRAVTYVGWNITRMQEPEGLDRNDRFIRTARGRVLRALSGS